MKNFKFYLIAISLIVLSACSQSDKLNTVSRSEVFIQNFNPPKLDILWVMDDRSPLNRIRTQLTSEATRFFQRLDATPRDYQMAFTNVNDGRLLGGPLVLTPNFGTVAQRSTAFSNLIFQTINLHTAAYNHAFLSAYYALTGHSEFSIRANVPLVMVFVSDTDEYSPTIGGAESVDYYSQVFLSLKGYNADLIKAYSINYRPLNVGETVNTTNRCTSHLYDADIDKPTFKDSFRRMATRLGGSFGDICGSFSDQIDLTGLRLHELPKSFELKNTPSVLSSIVVTVSDFSNNPITIPWIYDQASNSIVFATTPPEGATIQVIYQ